MIECSIPAAMLLLGSIAIACMLCMAFVTKWTDRRNKEHRSQEIEREFHAYMESYRAVKVVRAEIRNEVLAKYGIDIDKDQ